MKVLCPPLKLKDFNKLITVWRSSDQFHVNSSSVHQLPDFRGALLQVATLNTPPYVHVGHDIPPIIEGYLVDLLEIFASKLNFRYNITPVEDGEFGLFNGTHWTGVIGAVGRGAADLGLANLSPTLPRSMVAKFLGAGVGYGGFRMLLKKPDDSNHENYILAYLKPLSESGWICSASVLFIMAGSVCFAHHMYTKTIKPSIENSVSQKKEVAGPNANQLESLELKNVIFLALQTVAQQGLYQVPEEASTRVVLISLWILSVLLFSGYSATLTSFFTHSGVTLPFSTVEELLNQKTYAFGFQKGTSYLTRVNATTTHNLYNALSARLDANPSYLVSSINEALKRASTEKYVFMHEQQTLNWLASQSCDFIVIGPAYMKAEVTLAVQHNSPYYHGLTNALASLHENGVVQRLQDKWWPKGLVCDARNGQFKALTLTEVMLPLLLLTFGLVGGSTAGIVETVVFLIKSAMVISVKRPTRSKRKPRSHNLPKMLSAKRKAWMHEDKKSSYFKFNLSPFKKC